MLLLAIFVALVAMICLNVPIAVALALSAVLGLFMTEGYNSLVTIALPDRALRLEIDVTPGLHLLSLETLGGQPVIPGDVHLASTGREATGPPTVN